MPPERALAAILALQSKGMIEQGGSNRGQALYQLTVEGQEHFQRRTTARVAEPAPLPVKSDRVQALLSCMAERGEMRIVELGRALGIAQQSMNALMQYLKRKGLVRKMGRDLYAPYVLTDEGKATLTEMTLRNSQ